MENAKKFVINRFNEDFSKLENLPNDALFFSEDVTNKHLGIICTEFIRHMQSIETVEDVIDLFTVNRGNKKIESFSIISNGLYYLCPNLLNQKCPLSHRCYGAKNERFRTVIRSRLKNYIFFAFLEYFLLNMDSKTYIYVVDSAIAKNSKKLTKIIRINQQSDFRDDTQLFIFNDILMRIKQDYDKETIFYSYSKSDCDFGLYCNKDFRVNQSIVIENEDDLILFALTKPHYKNMYYLCLMDKNISTDGLSLKPCKNDCSNCKQCAKFFEKTSNAKFTFLH